MRRTVGVGRIKEVYTKLHSLMQYFQSLIIVTRPIELTHAHAAETNGRNFKAICQMPSFHAYLPAVASSRWQERVVKKLEKTGKGISDLGNQLPKNLIWDDARAFLAVARTGTLTAAADALGVGIATLSRRIERIEAALGLPLFLRLQSGYQLTEDGSQLVVRAEAMEAAALSFSSEASAQADIAGKVRLATAENLATNLILPTLKTLRTKHPNLVIELITDINTVNLHRRDADLAVRMVKPDRGNVTLRRLGTLGYGLYCNEDYAACRQDGSEAATYETDDFICWSEVQSHLPAAAWVERVLRGRRPAVITTSLSTQVAAAKAGLGLAVLPHFLAQKEGLVCVDSDLGIDQTIYLVIHSDLAQSPRTRVVADFVGDLIIANRARLMGQNC